MCVCVRVCMLACSMCVCLCVITQQFVVLHLLSVTTSVIILYLQVTLSSSTHARQ